MRETWRRPRTPSTRRRCDDGLRHQLFVAANEWLRIGNVTGQYRYNFSLSSLLSARGFVRGPLRLLSTEYTARAVPYFTGYHNVIIVHTRCARTPAQDAEQSRPPRRFHVSAHCGEELQRPRLRPRCVRHPVEMMVSVFYCIADPKVCPVRSKFLGNHVPVNDTLSSLDKFVLTGIRREGSTPYLILQRSEMLAQFITDFRVNWRTTTEGGQHTGDRGCGAPVLVHSKYEDMVSNYSTWARLLVGPLTGDADRPAQQQGLLTTLLERYKNDFVPDGKHKHTLKMGGNIAKLKRSTVRHLVRNRRVRATLDKLAYDWLGHDQG